MRNLAYRFASLYNESTTKEVNGMADQQQLDLLRQGVEPWNTWRKRHPDISPDLKRADLIRADLFGANLSKAILFRANLSGADLSRANLIRANLNGADLYEATLSHANLSGADLIGANLRKADLVGANL